MPLPGTCGNQYVSVSIPRLRGKAPNPVRQPAACEHSPSKGFRHCSRMRNSATWAYASPSLCEIVSSAPFGKCVPSSLSLRQGLDLRSLRLGANWLDRPHDGDHPVGYPAGFGGHLSPFQRLAFRLPQAQVFLPRLVARCLVHEQPVDHRRLRHPYVRRNNELLPVCRIARHHLQGLHLDGIPRGSSW